ncbi:Phosphatidate cytidylyltransferase, mitochondrial [Hypsibius exemplaris]|uniref:Phosphatidate cytidylyltransferase, mitochondrial n=1 Tax=Hypsibius exemplaris TaxID=2072580 RepID=A0A1W0WWP9_HYPEX|nr:Phosphatidate cytidylyltransferase, mitochondrial [Hypsibius exemplaris]
MAYMRAAETSIHKAFAASVPGDVRLMFAYGSGVFKQRGHGDEKANMLDYILVVDNAVQWHTANLARNRGHYSFLKYGGPDFITEIQRKYGAGIYFNTLVPFENRLVKYGVIATEDLKDDMKNWTTLYVSGRLHKPVLLVTDNTNADTKTCLEMNLRAAVQTSLLLLRDTFTDEELFLTIASLSYAGDFRMTFGEDKNKIKNIVLPHIEEFHLLYRPILKDLRMIDPSANFRTFRQEGSPASRLALLTALPANIRESVIREHLPDNRNKDVNAILTGVAYSPEVNETVFQACHSIVNRSSWGQSVKGIFTAGIRKSIVYGSAKVKKMLKSLKAPQS